MGAYGDARGLTPNLDALAEDSLVFRAAYTPASFTLPSVASIMTGRYPSALGLWGNESKIPDSTETLAKRLDEHGWNTAAVVSNWVLRESSGLSMGFDRFDDDMSDREATRGAPERLAPDTTDAAIAAADECAREGKSCFLWVHYQDPHGPYDPPDELRAAHLANERSREDGRRRLPVLSDHGGMGGIPRYQFLGGHADVGFYRAGYAGEVSFVDAEIGRLLATLDDQGLLSNAIVVFTADHGESLGEGDLWFAHGEHLSEAIVHVPLLIRSPGLEPGNRTGVVSLVDLYPTLLSLALGAEAREPTESQGPVRHHARDLMGSLPREEERGVFLATLGGSAIPRYAFVEGRYKLTLSEPNGSAEWDVRLLTRGDDELDLSEVHPELRTSMVQKVRQMQRATAGAERVWQELGTEDESKLRALGYATD
ncbi:sulfatase [Myxococcota bacterium]|nr:sulfatase [Myxococcota bacterium]